MLSILYSGPSSDITHRAYNITERSDLKETEKVNQENDWTGSASYLVKTSSKHSSRHQYASDESESSSVFEMYANISRGFGTAGSSLAVSESRSNSEWYTGTKTNGGYHSEGQAHGQDTTDIVVEFSEDENGKTTYSIFIPIPACTGKKIKTSYEGGVSESIIGQDEGMIQIEHQPLGNDPNLIQGEIIEKTTNENGETTESILRWSFIKGPLDIELLISPENYDTWLPEPGADESTPGNSINISLKLQNKKGGEPLLKAKAFELKLISTSTEPGTTINYPLTKPTPFVPDLKLTGSSINNGQELIIVPQHGATGTATLVSFDGGGYTTLKVEAILEGGSRIQGKLNIAPHETEILIPKRAAGSKIATHWLKEHGMNMADDHWDDEVSMGNENNGDGLTMYEEYRGVISSGKFTRLNPKVKELGVKMLSDQIPTLQVGLDLFSAASGIKIIPFFENEIDQSRMINRNKSAGTRNSQYALQLLIIDTLPGDTVGENRPINISNKTPKLSEMTVVDIKKIKQLYAEQRQAFDKAGVPPLYSEEDEIANTIAHELAHGVCVTHHGKNSNVIPRRATKDSKTPFALYDTYGGHISIPDSGIALYHSIGDNKGNESSGDLNCIIAYTTRYKWYFEQAQDRTLTYRSVPPMPQGTSFCRSGKGTGINATGFFGDAPKGNCLGQIKVKDE